jgi:copper chaperone CopZ
MTVEETFEIGICCPGCAKTATNAVRDLDGVDDADADHGENSITVEFDDSVVSSDDVVRAAESAGCGMS